MENNLDKQYTELLQDILDNGVIKKDRTGTGTLSVFGRTIRHKMSEGFPLLTSKHIKFDLIVTELLWFLRGDTNIKFLVDNGCNIWNGDAYKFFKNSFPIKKSNPPKDYINENGQLLTQEEFINKIKTDDEFTNKWGSLGPIYGAQWRNWIKYGNDIKVDGVYTQYSIDQIANLINDLKTNPDSRRLMVTAWNPADLDYSVLPPCHYGFQVYTRDLSDDERQKWVIDNVDWVRNAEDPKHEANKYLYRGEPKIYGDTVPKRAISLMYNARSQDFPLGTPFNISSYALLLDIIGKMVNMVPDELIANMGDCHIYLNQIDGIKEQLTREPFPLPTLKHMKTDDFYKSLSDDLSLLTHLDSTDFIIENYQSHSTIKMPLSN
jgi:thymidylate synthase